MSVTFFVSRGTRGQRLESAETVEMANGTARVVLRLLGLPSEGYLEGSLPLEVAAERLSALDDAAIAAAVVPPRQLGPRWRDNGTPRAWLDECLGRIRQAVADGKRLGATRLVWK